MTTTRFARSAAVLTATGALTGALPVGHASATPTRSAPPPATACPTGWGSLPKAKSTMVAGPMTNLRAGRHDCFDRLVVDLRGRSTGYRVEYVSQLVQGGSGAVVPIRGGAKLKITVNAPAYDTNGQATYQPANPKEAVNVSGYSTLRQVRWLGSYEGASEMGVGVRARLPFRVFTLADATSSRVVIDVAHRW
ncbi:AMIN-like domain-containing (lipo)protein [Nostocoides australiense]